MERLKFNTENDGAMDALERPDVRAVWEQVTPTLDETLKKAGRYESVGWEAVRPENVRDYGEDRTEENLEMLEKLRNPQLAELYKKVVEENPQLCVVKLVDEDIEKNAMFCRTTRDTTTGQVMPAVGFNFSHPETYGLKVTEMWAPRKEEGGEVAAIKYTMKSLALRVGADWRRCARNRKLTTAMAFLHEMGHMKDYIDNYLVPEYQVRGEMGLDERMAESVRQASARAAAERAEGAQEFEGEHESMAARLKAYREMPDEKRADEFALGYLTEHFEEYFVEEEPAEGVKAKARDAAVEVARDFAFGEGKVKVEPGREFLMDEDFVCILGLTKGSSVKIEPVLVPEKKPTSYDLREGDYGIYGYERAKRYDEDGNYIPKHARREVGKHERLGGEGEIMTTLTEGGPIYLHDAEGAVRVCESASGFRYVSQRGEGGQALVEVYFNDGAGRKYRVVSKGDSLAEER